MKLNLIFQWEGKNVGGAPEPLINVGLVLKNTNGTNIRFAAFRPAPNVFEWNKLGDYGKIKHVEALLGSVGHEYTLEQVWNYDFENPPGKKLMIMPGGAMYLSGVPTCQHLPNIWVQGCYEKWHKMDVATVPVSVADISPELIAALAKGYGIDFCDPKIPQNIVTALTPPVDTYGPSMFGHENISLQVGDRVELMLSNSKIDWRIKLAAIWYAAIHSKPWILIEPIFRLKDYVHQIQKGVVIFEEGGPSIPISNVWNGGDFANNILAAIRNSISDPNASSKHFVSAFYEVTTKLPFMEQRILCDIALNTMKSCILAIRNKE